MTETHNSALNIRLRYIGCESWQCFKFFPTLSSWQLTADFYMWSVTVWEFLSEVWKKVWPWVEMQYFTFYFKFIARSNDINTKWKQIGDCLFKTRDHRGIGGNETSLLYLEENTALWKGEGGKFYLIGFLFLKLCKVICSFIWPEFYSGCSHFQVSL